MRAIHPSRRRFNCIMRTSNVSGSFGPPCFAYVPPTYIAVTSRSICGFGTSSLRTYSYCMEKNNSEVDWKDIIDLNNYTSSWSLSGPGPAAPRMGWVARYTHSELRRNVSICSILASNPLNPCFDVFWHCWVAKSHPHFVCFKQSDSSVAVRSKKV